MYGTFGVGWFWMFLMIGLPIFGVIIAAIALAGLFQNRQFDPVKSDNQTRFYQSSDSSSDNQPARYCVHCGAGLQTGWTHCPQCGTPVQS